MPERWVVNASPLILLARVGRAGLLQQLADEVIVPQAVAAEIGAGPEDDPARRLIGAGAWPIVETPPALADLLAWDLGAGETAVLTYARANSGWTAILDDAAARKCAQSFDLPMKGTLAVVILAKQRDLIGSAAEAVRDLQAAGFRIDDQLIRSVLKATVGEEWATS